ncbi:MAG TPA: hypothetical protein VGC99_04265 [Candidatus Tectomicrobia bacterium]|jgi:hypothetical protein
MREEVLGALTGRRIVITRPRAQAVAWMRQLRSLGAAPLCGQGLWKSPLG